MIPFVLGSFFGSFIGVMFMCIFIAGKEDYPSEGK